MAKKTSQPFLTIGMPTAHDWPGVWATITSLVNHHDCSDVEILVIDDYPNTETGRKVRSFVEKWVANRPDVHSARYIGHKDPTGPALAKNDVFLNARGKYVLCIDCHIDLPTKPESCIERLKDHFRMVPDTMDLYCGPNILDDGTTNQTELIEKWRGEAWGIWHYNEKGATHDMPPYEIWGSGCGLMACKKTAWLGFNPHMKGFGGEEGYIHEKFRLAGRKVWNLPFMRWQHRYGNPEGVKFPIVRERKVCNYVLEFLELGRDIQEIYDHFVSLAHPVTDENPEGTLEKHLIEEHSFDVNGVKDPKTGAKRTLSYEEMQAIHAKFKIPEQNWRHIVNDPQNAFLPGSPEVENKPVNIKPETLEEKLTRAVETKKDLNDHIPSLMGLVAMGCNHVTDITRRSESTIAFLAAKPQHLRTYIFGDEANPTFGADVQRITPKGVDMKLFLMQGGHKEVELEEETDLVFFKCPHNYHDLGQALDRWAPKVRRFIAIHDTQDHGPGWEGEAGPGLTEGMKTFLKKNPEWFIYSHDPRQWGMTVLGKQEQDKPSKVIHAWPPGKGVGTEIMKITKLLDIVEKPGCKCRATALEMDIVGIAEVKRRREDYAKRIRENASNWNWKEKLEMAPKAVKNGIILNPLDIYGSLVDLAIRNAEKAEAEELKGGVA